MSTWEKLRRNNFRDDANDDDKGDGGILCYLLRAFFHLTNGGFTLRTRNKSLTNEYAHREMKINI